MKSAIPAYYREPHYSTRFCRAQFLYVSKNYSRELFTEICDELGMPLDYLLKDDNWISDRFFRDFMDRLKAKTGDDDISEKFGKYTVSPEAINPLEYAVNQTILVPALFYLGVPLQYSRYNNVHKVGIRRWRPGFFHFEISPKSDVLPSPDACKNAVGVLSGTDSFFGLDALSVDHHKCMHRGDRCCEFIVKYSSRTFWMRRLRLLAGFLAVGLSSVFAFQRLREALSDHALSLPLLFLAAYSFAGAALFVLTRHLKLLKYIQQYNDQSRAKSGELYENYRRLERKYSEANLLRDMSNKLAASFNTKTLLRSCLEELHHNFGYGRSLIMLLSGDKSRLFTADALGFEKAGSDFFNFSVKYPSPDDNPQLFANILQAGDTRAITDMEAFKNSLKPANRALIDALGVNSLVVAPIQDQEEKYGLLIIGALKSDRPLNDDDKLLIENITKLLSLSFQSTNQLEKETNLRTLFQKYVPAIVLDGVNNLAPGKSNFLPKIGNVASMFIDLRDFTPRCEHLSPEKVVELLNIYTEFVTGHISNNGGIIDKLVGDGIHAFFVQDSNSSGSYCTQALSAAVAVLADLSTLEEKFRERGFGAASLGIGIHAGRAIIGSMGCDRKMDYTAIGDTVNLASRLQEISKQYRTKTASASRGLIILTEATFRSAGITAKTEHIGQTPIRGRAQSEQLLFIDLDSASSIVNSLKEKGMTNAA